MADTTSKGISARTLASIASKRLGRTVTDKRVRSVARDTIERFGDDAYTAHAYTPDEAAGIIEHLRGRGRGVATMTADEASAALDAALAPQDAPQDAGKGKVTK